MQTKEILAALLLLLGLDLPLAASMLAPTALIAQVTPSTTTGKLDENSGILEDDGSYFNVYTFEGQAGETVSIEMLSEAFDTYLLLRGPEGQVIAQDDDGYGGTNSLIVVTLPATGTYRVIANSYTAGATGQYTLTWTPATAADAAQVIALRRATELNQQASELYQSGRYGEAEPLYQQSLTIRREQLGERHADVASSLNSLALLYVAQGRYGEAEPLYQQSLTIRREQLGDRHPDVATSLNNLAALYFAQGRYGEAEPLFQASLSILRQQLGERHADVASSLNNLALLYGTQGRYGEAEPLYQQSLMIRREQLGDRHPDVATSLNNLAALYFAQERYGEAEPRYQEALSIFRERLGESHPNVAQILNNLASLYVVQGRYGEAEPLFQSSLSIRREQLGERHPDVTESLNNLAELYRAQGFYGEAEPLYQQSLTIRREQLGDRHPDVATSLNNLAALYQAQGFYGEAVAAFQAGLAIEEWHLELNLATLTEAQRQDYAATLSGTTDAATFLALQTPEAKSLGLTTLLRRKGRLLGAGSSSLQRLQQNLTPADQATLDNLLTVRQQLATLTFNPPPNLPSEQYRVQLAQLETEATDLEKTLAQRSAAFRVESQPVDIEAVRSQIPPDSVLVEYARYRPFDAQANFGDHFGTPRYAAYLLFPDGRIEVIDLGDAAEIDAAIDAFVSLLQTRSANFRQAAPVLRPDVVEGMTRNLRTLIFDPLAPSLQATDHLLISPDSQLNRVPFEALPTETGGDYLVQQYQISYLNSGRDLLRFGVVEPSRNPAVILADPDYETIQIAQGRSLGDNRRSIDLNQIRFGRLPGTAAEAAVIQPLLPNATVLVEDEATENALKQVEAPQILHIATHGFFLANVERPSSEAQRGIGIISSDTPFARPTTPSVAIENPLLRSGLALAGFNTRQSGSEDGVLTALEASTLNLSGTQLVVLSACETGLGDIANGEGVYGLRRAFALAGAETQLMSLWQVSDDGTQSLMARYYEKLIAGMGRSEALRAVQLEMIAAGGEFSHPYYWSAFILAGDWRPL
ncbi:tetratricopeptide repeat protein [Halomicronema sp. CCY15110]|uniref:tetratricopeptide repeat protein n=1 Tax=Halomicronema sp. CCY15110 TaxID=2767773 RepID=UPI00194F0A15|nr:tetratricopeptide repeat protein [Halomicronema sp. CCY15110]